MVLEGDGPARPLALADGQVLVEGLGALDGRRVGADGLVDVIRGPVGGDGAFVGASRPGVVSPVRLDDIVLHQGARRPAVESDKAVTGGGEGAGIVYSAVLVSALFPFPFLFCFEETPLPKKEKEEKKKKNPFPTPPARQNHDSCMRETAKARRKEMCGDSKDSPGGTSRPANTRNDIGRRLGPGQAVSPGAEGQGRSGVALDVGREVVSAIGPGGRCSDGLVTLGEVCGSTLGDVHSRGGKDGRAGAGYGDEEASKGQHCGFREIEMLVGTRVRLNTSVDKCGKVNWGMWPDSCWRWLHLYISNSGT